jgi:hypothetical protein
MLLGSQAGAKEMTSSFSQAETNSQKNISKTFSRSLLKDGSPALSRKNLLSTETDHQFPKLQQTLRSPRYLTNIHPTRHGQPSLSPRSPRLPTPDPADDLRGKNALGRSRSTASLSSAF